jgi:hypothetical protein
VVRADLPPVAAIVFADEREPPMLGGVEMARQLGDLGFEVIE